MLYIHAYAGKTYTNALIHTYTRVCEREAILPSNEINLLGKHEKRMLDELCFHQWSVMEDVSHSKSLQPQKPSFDQSKQAVKNVGETLTWKQRSPRVHFG